VADDTPRARITAAALIQGARADIRSRRHYRRCPLTVTSIAVFSAVVITAAAVFNVATAFTVIAAAFTVIAAAFTVITVTTAVSVVFAVFTATAAVSVYSASASDSVMKVTYPPFYFLTFITSNGLHAYGHTHRPSPIQ
jgi:hypothetical protein